MTNTPRLVYFGMHGVYSTTLLRALVASGLAPALVVVGVEKPRLLRGPLIRTLPARPTFWQRLGGHTPGGTPAAPAVTDLAEVAHGAGIDVVLTDDPDVLPVRAEIHGAQPELLVVGGFPRLLSPRVLTLAPKGGLNVHPGRLPAERGPAPVFWALKAGRTRVGVTVHVLDAGEDSGDVISTAEVSFEPGTDGLDIHRRAAHAAAPLLVRAIRATLAGDVVRIPQPQAGRGRCPRPVFRDGHIDPGQRAVDVYTFVGGCARHYSLFVEIAGDRFFVKAALSYQVGGHLPSEYVVSANTLLLRCVDGVVELELKPEGAIFSAEYSDHT